jgi:DNA-binding MarR family transcriptional regulator
MDDMSGHLQMLVPEQSEPVVSVSDQCARLLKFCHETNLTLLDLSILSAVCSAGAMKTQNVVGHELGAKGASLTQPVDRMDAAGLLTRARESEDRRIVTLRATPLGLQTYHKLIQTLRPGDARFA